MSAVPGELGGKNSDFRAAHPPLDTNYEITSQKSGVYVVSDEEKPAHKNGRFDGPLQDWEHKQLRDISASILATKRESEALDRVRRWAMLAAVRELMPRERVSSCCTVPAHRYLQEVGHEEAERVGVSVHRSELTGDARYGNLAVCGDVWRCPICAPYIAADRAGGLRELGRAHMGNGGGAALVTLTFRHQHGDDLADIVRAFQEAREWLHRHRDYKTLLKDFGYIGSVRTLEVTHGKNGWHPHTHDLVFLAAPLATSSPEVDGVVMIAGEAVETRYRKPSSLQMFSARYWRLWRKAARRFGLEVARDAFSVRATLSTTSDDEWDKLTQYVQDRHLLEFGGGWDAAREMTAGSLKIARRDGATPFQLLADFAIDGDAYAGALFFEYASVFKGRRQLVYSRGLRERYELAEPVTDEAAAAALPDEFAPWASITWDVWKTVLRAGGRVRGELLQLAALDDLQGFHHLVEACKAGTIKEKVTFRGMQLRKQGRGKI